MWWEFLVCALGGYLLGSVPVGLIVGRVVRGIDIRQYGSGKTGATNVLRTVGARWGAVALAGDLAKGVIPVVVARVLSDEPYVQTGAGPGWRGRGGWPPPAGTPGGCPRGPSRGWAGEVSIGRRRGQRIRLSLDS